MWGCTTAALLYIAKARLLASASREAAAMHAGAVEFYSPLLPSLWLARLPPISVCSAVKGALSAQKCGCASLVQQLQSTPAGTR